MFVKYSRLVIGHPLPTICLTLAVSAVLTVLGVYHGYEIVDFDPAKGFETRNTDSANSRLFLENLKGQQASNSRIIKWYYEQELSRNKREIEKEFDESPNITVNYDDYGVDFNPNFDDLNDSCEFFGSIGVSIPYDAIEYMAKIMVKFESLDELFNINTLRHLCYLDSLIDDHILDSNFTDPASKIFKHSLNLPLYTTCPNMSTVNSCGSLNQNDISQFRSLIDACLLDPTLSTCQAYSIDQVINWLLPVDQNNPIISIVLKISKFRGDNLEFYQNLVKKLNFYMREVDGMQLVGVDFNIKNEEFRSIIWQDTLLAGMSALLVIMCFLLYSKSVLFTAVIVTLVSLSAGVAFFIYAIILRIEFFPFINLLVVVVLASIGADDAFLLLVYYRKNIDKVSRIKYKIGDTYTPIYHEHDLLAQSLRASLRHSLISMFVTSLTTATTFLTNLSSHVIVLKCFGIYAFLTILVNYFLVLLILPSTMILLKRPEPSHCYKSQIEKVVEFSAKFKHVIFFISIFLSCLSSWYIFYYLEIPKTNPTKVLVSSNVHEFYDDNVHCFNVQWKRSARIMKNYLFGAESYSQNFELLPTLQKRRWKVRNDFNITLENLMFYNNIASLEWSKYSTHQNNFTYIPWSDKILKLNETCLEDQPISSDCILKLSVKYSHYLHQFPDDFSVTPGDGPLIDEDFQIVGYFISIPTDEKLRVNADAISHIFEEIESTCNFLRQNHTNVLCSSSPEVTRFYDIIRQLKTSTYTSVALSVMICLVVIIGCTRQLTLSLLPSFVILSIILWTIAILILFGWKLSVVESTILIIIIGLSFDYTLHYVVAFRDADSDTTGKTISAHSTAGIVCVFGALTLCLAGFPLLFSGTASFSQVGQMLLVLGTTSLIGASIVLPAMYMCFHTSNCVTKL